MEVGGDWKVGLISLLLTAAALVLPFARPMTPDCHENDKTLKISHGPMTPKSPSVVAGLRRHTSTGKFVLLKCLGIPTWSAGESEN